MHDFGIYHRVFMYARHNGVARNYFGHCIVGKIYLASISARLSYKLTSFSAEWTQKHNFVSTIGFSGMPELVEWFGSTLDIALWVKSKMAAICEN